MTPKKKRAPNELKDLQDAERQIDTRSIYGENRAANEDAMMAAHAKQLRQGNIINGSMEAELSRPRYRVGGELQSRYTPEYLSTHPDYTGQNAHAMPTYDTALKHCRDEDAAEGRFLDDYEAGTIDEWGNRIGVTNEHTGDTMETTGSFSGNSITDYRAGSQTRRNSIITQPIVTGDPSKIRSFLTALTPQKYFWMPPQHYRPTSNPQNTSEGLQNLPTSAPRKAPAGAPQTASIVISNSISPSLPHQSSKPRRFRERRSQERRSVSPLTPLPHKPNYTELDYYTAAALCRDRGIPSGGNAQEVRNHLIRDDINIAHCRERERANTSPRKVYVHQAPTPAELRNMTTKTERGGKGPQEIVDGCRIESGEGGDNEAGSISQSDIVGATAGRRSRNNLKRARGAIVRELTREVEKA